MALTMHRNSRKPVVEVTDHTGKLIALMWCAFAGTACRALLPQFALVRQSGRLILDLAICAAIGLGLSTLLRGKQILPQKNIFVPIFFAVSAFTLANGLVGNRLSPYTFIYGVLPAFLVSICWSNILVFDEQRLLRHLTWQLQIGTVIAIFTLAGLGDATRDDWYGTEQVGAGVESISCLYAVFFLLPAIRRLSIVQGVSVLVALGAFLGHTMVAESRGMVLTAIICGGFAVVSSFLTGKNAPSTARKMVRVFGITTLIGFFCISIGWRRLNMEEKLWATVGRLSNVDMNYGTGRDIVQGTIATSRAEYLENGGRAVEAREYIEALTWREWLFGRGFGGVWDSIVMGPDRPMVHFMPVHFIHLGGLLFLMSFLGLLWFTIKNALKVSISPVVKACSVCFIVYYLLNVINHGGSFSDSIETFVFWICLALLNRQTMGHPRPWEKNGGNRLADSSRIAVKQ